MPKQFTLLNLSGEPGPDGHFLSLDREEIRRIDNHILTAAVDASDDAVADHLLWPGALVTWQRCMGKVTQAEVETSALAFQAPGGSVQQSLISRVIHIRAEIDPEMRLGTVRARPGR